MPSHGIDVKLCVAKFMRFARSHVEVRPHCTLVVFKKQSSRQYRKTLKMPTKNKHIKYTQHSAACMCTYYNRKGYTYTVPPPGCALTAPHRGNSGRIKRYLKGRGFREGDPLESGGLLPAGWQTEFGSTAR